MTIVGLIGGLGPESTIDVPALDTTALHVAAIVERLRA